MWFNPGGTEMTDEEWNSGFVRCVGMLLSGKAIDVRDEKRRTHRGRHVSGAVQREPRVAAFHAAGPGGRALGL